MADLWSEDGLIKFRAGLTLRSDHVLRDIIYKVTADSATSEVVRGAIIAAVFEEIEAAIDDAVAVNGMAAN